MTKMIVDNMSIAELQAAERVTAGIRLNSAFNTSWTVACPRSVKDMSILGT